MLVTTWAQTQTFNGETLPSLLDFENEPSVASEAVPEVVATAHNWL